jgi:hypothetical protein
MEAKEKPEVTCYGKFKNHMQAWQEADKAHPGNMKTLIDIHKMNNYDLSTLEDYRWFVLFNVVFAIDRKVNHSKQHTYLQRIQENILFAAHKFLGKTGRITKVKV